MGIDLYYMAGSAPCRTVQLVAAALGVDLNLKNLNLMKGEHKTPEYLKLNPQHTVPTMVDNGFSLWESRAIVTYLASQHAKADVANVLYPKDPKARALVDQRLYFDLGTLYNAFNNYYYPIIFTGATGNPAMLEKIHLAFEFLEKFLEGQKYVAGDHLTIADLAIIVTVSNFEVMKYDMEKFPNVKKWASKIKSEAKKYNEINGEGVKAFSAFVESLKKK